MRPFLVIISIAALASVALAQQPTMPTAFGEKHKADTVSKDDSKPEGMWESKIKVEWDALKN